MKSWSWMFELAAENVDCMDSEKWKTEHLNMDQAKEAMGTLQNRTNVTATFPSGEREKPP